MPLQPLFLPLPFVFLPGSSPQRWRCRPSIRPRHPRPQNPWCPSCWNPPRQVRRQALPLQAWPPGPVLRLPGLWPVREPTCAVRLSCRRPCVWHGPAKAVSRKPQPRQRWKGWCEKMRACGDSGKKPNKRCQCLAVWPFPLHSSLRIRDVGFYTARMAFLGLKALQTNGLVSR